MLHHLTHPVLGVAPVDLTASAAGNATPPYTQAFVAESLFKSSIYDEDSIKVEPAPVVWQELADGDLEWDEAAAQLLLSVADPSRVNWQAHLWWGGRNQSL